MLSNADRTEPRWPSPADRAAGAGTTGHTSGPQFDVKPAHSANLRGVDFAQEAKTFTRFGGQIIDAHSHIVGERSARLYGIVAELYGIKTTLTMTPLEDVPTIRGILGDRVQFIAQPLKVSSGEYDELTSKYRDRLRAFADHGAKIAKFWNAPPIYKNSDAPFATSPYRLDNPGRMETMQYAIDLGMKLMVHVADPDTWFACKFQDAQKFGTKDQQYGPLENVLSAFPSTPVIAAHFGGYPENLSFLSGLLERHSNLYLDCSATKWMVRELSKHPPEVFAAFLQRWSGRILFGSDIVTTDLHFEPTTAKDGSNAEVNHAKASTAEQAFDLHASRYWSLRTVFEGTYDGPSLIEDADLAMASLAPHDPRFPSPRIRGMNLPEDVLASLYFGAASQLLSI